MSELALPVSVMGPLDTRSFSILNRGIALYVLVQRILVYSPQILGLSSIYVQYTEPIRIVENNIHILFTRSFCPFLILISVNASKYVEDNDLSDVSHQIIFPLYVL